MVVYNVIRRGGDYLSIGERIKEVRKKSGLTQQKFAERIGLKRNTIGNYEINLIEPSDRTILDICREFDIREPWLRTGEGEPFVEKSREENISDFMGSILSGEPDFRRKFISVLARMTPEEWDMLEKKVLELAEEIKAGP